VHYLWLAACCAAADKKMAAKQAAREALALRPNLATYFDGDLLSGGGTKIEAGWATPWRKLDCRRDRKLVLLARENNRSSIGTFRN